MASSGAHTTGRARAAAAGLIALLALLAGAGGSRLDALGAAGAVPDAAGHVPRAAADATAVAIVDDFEDPGWPTGSPWTIPVDPEDPRTERYQWAPRDCRATAGQRSLWSVGGGTEGSLLPCGAAYPANARTVAVLHLDLRPYADAGTLNLAFDMWADTLSDAALGDFVSVIYREPTGAGTYERVTVYDWTGATGPDFRTIRLDLLDLADVFNPHNRFNLAGTESDFELVFRTARDSTFRPEGVHVDLVRLEHDGDVTATATGEATEPPTGTPPVGPTVTVTPATAAPTVTPTATATADSSGTAAPTPATAATIHLPVCRNRG